VRLAYRSCRANHSHEFEAKVLPRLPIEKQSAVEKSRTPSLALPGFTHLPGISLLVRTATRADTVSREDR